MMLAGIGLAMSAALPPPGEQVLVFAPLRSMVDADATIGARRTGQFCLPAGHLRWDDVAPDASATADALALAFGRSSMRAITTDELTDAPVGLDARQRITATVVAAHVDTCVPQHGLIRHIGGRSRAKVKGWVKVRWRLLPTSRNEQPRDLEDQQPVLLDAEGSIRGGIRDAIVRSGEAVLRPEDGPSPARP